MTALSRLQQGLACRAAGLTLHFAPAGFELASERLGVVLAARATGTLAVSVVDYPALTGLEVETALLDAGVSREFAPGDIVVEGHRLVCLAREPLAPQLAQGFVLQLEPGMADVLLAWLPRLERVAATAADVARRIEAVRGLEPSGAGLAFCAEVVAGVVLDLQPSAAALAAARREHWASAVDDWQAAFDTPELRARLEAARLAAPGGAGARA